MTVAARTFVGWPISPAGPILIPSTGIVSFDQNAALNGWDGGKFIDANGYWKSATAAAPELPELTRYKSSNDDKALLSRALDEVYLKINREYIDFAGACVQTGRSQGAWPYLEKTVKPRGKSSGLCFLTTACVQARGLPDDCEYLRVLREFRDHYVVSLPEGPKLIKEYYRVAPAIVRGINLGSNSLEMYFEIYRVISYCVAAIKIGDVESALIAYMQMVVNLRNELSVHSQYKGSGMTDWAGPGFYWSQDQDSLRSRSSLPAKLYLPQPRP